MDLCYRNDRPPILVRKVVLEQNGTRRKTRGGVYESITLRQGDSKVRATPAKSVVPGQKYFVRFDRGYHPVVADSREVMHPLQFPELEDPRYS